MDSIVMRMQSIINFNFECITNITYNAALKTYNIIVF